MATTPITADGGTLAIRPARLNIFAKPNAGQGYTSPAARPPRGVFDEAAACRSANEVASGFVAASDDGAARRGGASGPQRLACLLALLAAIVAVIVAIPSHPRRDRAVTVPPPRSHRDGQQPRARPAARRRPTQPRVGHRRRARIRHVSSRAARATNSGLRSQRPHHASAAPATSPVLRRRVPAAGRPVPSRVAPDAPPEFM